MKLGLSQIPTTSLVQKMHLGMRLSMLLDLPREDFWKTVKEIEDSEVFQKLFWGKNRVIRINPIKKCFIPPEGTGIAPESSDVESLLEGREKILEKIRRLGPTSFSLYFLQGECSDGELAELLDISREDVKRFREEVLNRVFVADIIGSYNAPGISAGNPTPPGETVAEIYVEGESVCVSCAREKVRYKIDESRFEEMVCKGEINSKEQKKFKEIKQKMEWINRRFNLLNQIIEKGAEYQKRYLISMDSRNLRCLEEKEVADQLRVDPSWVSRLIKNKFIRVRGKVLPLVMLFPSERHLKKLKGIILIREILREKKRPLSDEQLKQILASRYNMRTTRRTVNNWRREAEIKESGSMGS